ncbi:MAG: bifunctional glycoside hydrolase 114/ polysaccharide deacetylase family protein [Burkholderiaceae bacterium]
MLFLLLTVMVGVRAAGAAQAPALPKDAPTVAWHYGTNPPLETLKAFDIIVVEPGHDLKPTTHRSKTAGRSELFAYVSIGELHPTRSYASQMPAEMLVAVNETWNSQIIDQSHPDWPAFFVNQIIAPLWKKGYRGFFLDTMDSYHLISEAEPNRRALKDGMLRALGLLHERHPTARLITNRGFEVLDELHQKFEDHLVAVAAESLFGRWDHRNKRYVRVPSADRQWLKDRLTSALSKGIPAISIDYAPADNRKLAREIARDISNLGLIPYVTNGEINQIGIGSFEIIPRRVLLLHNGSQPDGDEHYSTAQRIIKMPLHYLGYRVDLVDVRTKSLPKGVLAGEYAAVVGAFEKDVPDKTLALRDFYERAYREGVPLVFLNGFGIDSNREITNRLKLLRRGPTLRGRLKAVVHDPDIANYEIKFVPQRGQLSVRAPEGSIPILSVEGSRNQRRDIAAITPWGGFATVALSSISVKGGSGSRWVIDPIEFFRKAIERGSPQLRPDLSTETGRRMLFIHIDGDGFASRAEIPGAPLAAEIMYRDFIKRYKVPHTVSVIEGETSRQGAYPALSPILEKIARKIFKLTHVEIASHSYSHPYFWRQVVRNEQKGINPSKKPHLPIKNYHFRLKRDIDGSVEYIDRRLAPPGKKTAVFLWTGDCVPPWEAIAATEEAGLLNMNGGDTTINRQEPTLTLVAPFSIRKNGYLQVFAPNQNENVYTNDWTGPFYGFTKVIETFEMTNHPRRLKPINIYYHTYSASKRSAITALHRVYRYALKQPVTPLYSSQYIRKAIDFESFVIARDVQLRRDGAIRWHYFGDGHLKTLRLHESVTRRIDWRRSPGTAGREKGVDGDYLHLTGASGTFVIRPPDSSKTQWTAATNHPAPIIRNGNGQITYFERTESMTRFGFTAHVDGLLEIEHPKHCTLRSRKKRLKPTSSRQSTSGVEISSYQFARADVQKEKHMTIMCRP